LELNFKLIILIIFIFLFLIYFIKKNKNKLFIFSGINFSYSPNYSLDIINYENNIGLELLNFSNSFSLFKNDFSIFDLSHPFFIPIGYNTTNLKYYDDIINTTNIFNDNIYDLILERIFRIVRFTIKTTFILIGYG
jgi:hypothetical protein